MCACMCVWGLLSLSHCLDYFLAEARQDEDFKEDLFVFVGVCDAAQINGH